MPVPSQQIPGSTETEQFHIYTQHVLHYGNINFITVNIGPLIPKVMTHAHTHTHTHTQTHARAHTHTQMMRWCERPSQKCEYHEYINVFTLVTNILFDMVISVL